MRGWCGEVQPGDIKSSPAPLWPIVGPVALWHMNQLSKYIRDCPLSLFCHCCSRGRFEVGGSKFAGAS